MTPLSAPTSGQIEAQIDALLDRRPDARVLGIRAPTRRTWPEIVERRGQCFRVAWCDSELEIREQLDAAEKDDAQRLVLITPLHPASLGGDVLARLPRARFEETDHWTALRAAFKARDVDPRLRARRWLADLLLDQAPPSGYPPAAGGVLDLDSAWRAAREQLLHLPEGRADAAALLRWTLDRANLDRFMALPADARQRIADHLSDVAGPATRLIIGAVAGGRGVDALAIALVCGVVFAAAEPSSDLREAAVRLEPLVGGGRIDPEEGAMLADVARRLVVRLEIGDSAAHTAQNRAAALLTEIHAERYAALSPTLFVGLEARMQDAAAALAAAAASGGEGEATSASEVVQRVFEHDRAFDQRARMERLEMAARLCRWLAMRDYPPTSFAGAAASYATDGGFADRARHALRPGDELPDVAAAYARLREVVDARREAENRNFAQLLRDWNAAGSFGTNPLPIERVLELLSRPFGPRNARAPAGPRRPQFCGLLGARRDLRWSGVDGPRTPGRTVAGSGCRRITDRDGGLAGEPLVRFADERRPDRREGRLRQSSGIARRVAGRQPAAALSQGRPRIRAGARNAGARRARRSDAAHHWYRAQRHRRPTLRLRSAGPVLVGRSIAAGDGAPPPLARRRARSRRNR